MKPALRLGKSHDTELTRVTSPQTGIAHIVCFYGGNVHVIYRLALRPVTYCVALTMLYPTCFTLPRPCGAAVASFHAPLRKLVEVIVIEGFLQLPEHMRGVEVINEAGKFHSKYIDLFPGANRPEWFCTLMKHVRSVWLATRLHQYRSCRHQLPSACIAKLHPGQLVRSGCVLSVLWGAHEKVRLARNASCSAQVTRICAVGMFSSLCSTNASRHWITTAVWTRTHLCAAR